MNSFGHGTHTYDFGPSSHVLLTIQTIDIQISGNTN